MISSVSYTAAAPSTAVAITMSDGTVWHTDASLPRDTEIRRALADWLAAGGVIEPYVAPPAPPPVLGPISDRQFFQALALPPYEIITTAEALAAVKTGALPAALAAIVAAIPDATARFNAEMILSGATQFERAHPMVAAIAGAMSPPWGEADIDEFWIFAGSL
jgi:hypothetical protein